MSILTMLTSTDWLITGVIDNLDTRQIVHSQWLRLRDLKRISLIKLFQ